MDMHGKKERHFEVHLEHRDGYSFESQAHEDGVTHGPPYASDEPAPVGEQRGAATPALLGSAVGHCLSASLLEHLRKAGVPVNDCQTEVDSVVAPGDVGLPRIARIDVTIKPQIGVPLTPEIEAAVGNFQEHCTVCASIRDSIAIEVAIEWQTLAG